MHFNKEFKDNPIFVSSLLYSVPTGHPPIYFAFFSNDIYVKTMRHSRFQLGQFFIHWFEIWQYYS